MSDFTRTKDTNLCLDCGARLDEATPVRDGHVPAPGDLSICIMCGCLAYFADDMSFRRPTPKESFELAANFEIQRVLKVMRQVRGRMQ